jgi:hypothetical protein
MWREIQDRWQFKPFPISQIRRGIAQFYRDQILLMADGVIPVSYFLKNQIIYHFNANIDFGKIMPVYNAINFAAFDETPKGNFKKKLGMTEDNKIILSVTSFNTIRSTWVLFTIFPLSCGFLRKTEIGISLWLVRGGNLRGNAGVF